MNPIQYNPGDRVSVLACPSPVGLGHYKSEAEIPETERPASLTPADATIEATVVWQSGGLVLLRDASGWYDGERDAIGDWRIVGLISEPVRAWSDGATVYLADQRTKAGASSVLSVLLYEADIDATIAGDEAEEKRYFAAKMRAGKLAERWRGLSFGEALAEFEAL